MRFEDADHGPINILYSQAELAVVLVLARQHPTSAVCFPDTVGYPFPRTPFGNVFLRISHRIKGHADARRLITGEAGSSVILDRRLSSGRRVWEGTDRPIEDG